MNGRAFVFFCCGILAVALSACSGGSNSSGSSDQGTPPAASAGGAAGAGAAGAGAPGGSPQGGYGGGGAQRGRRFGELLKSLNLTPDQETKIRAIVADARKKSEGADRETRRANMRAAYAEIENTVLTPAQKVQFEKKMAALRASYQSPSPAAQ